jgi:hypothetical protein
MLETSISQQEEFYRKNLGDVSDQHAQEIKLLNEAAKLAESRILEDYKTISEELIAVKKENQELKTRMASTKGGSNALTGDVQLLLNLQNENYTLQQKIKDVNVEKTAIMEKFKVT